jgi:hypothetical protein
VGLAPRPCLLTLEQTKESHFFPLSLPPVKQVRLGETESFILYLNYNFKIRQAPLRDHRSKAWRARLATRASSSPLQNTVHRVFL